MPTRYLSLSAHREEPSEQTSPEDLLAGAHSSSLAMAISDALTAAGHPPEHVRVDGPNCPASSTFSLTTCADRVAGTAGGLAAVGLQTCLWAGSVAAVGALMVQDGAVTPGVICDHDRWLALAGQTCPVARRRLG
ncbi:MAG: hypothetical protein ACRDUV_25965 [Pseudonocardiaceae bacterium]